MAGLQVVQKGGDADLLIVLEIHIAVDGIVDYRQKGIGIHPVHLTRLADGLVAKSQMNAKGAQCLQHTVIIFDQRNHHVAGFIHLLILHCLLLSVLKNGAKLVIFLK